MKRNLWLIILAAGFSAGSVQDVASQVPDDLPLPLPAAEVGKGEEMAPLVPAPKDQARRPFLNPDAPDGPSPMPGFPLGTLPAPDDLAGWVIARPPVRENRDAYMAYWTRVLNSKQRWNVVRDAGSGAVRVVQEGLPGPVQKVDAQEEGKAAVPPAFVLSADSVRAAAGVKLKLPAEPLTLMPDHALQVEDGWMVAQTRGLPMPVLAWFSADGARQQVISTDMVVRGVASLDGKVYALAGGPHSAVMEMVRREGRLATVEVQKLADLGLAMTTLPDGRLCIATSSRLLSLDPRDKKGEVLLSRPGWGPLEPRSMLYDAKSNRVYVGLRHFVARCAVEPGKRGVVFLRPGG